MPIDSRKLKPSEVARLLNSTPLGPVIDERQLYRHRMQAGFRLGGGRHIDFLRYVAWLAERWHSPRSRVDAKTSYEDQKARVAQRNKEFAEAGRDIGQLPAIANPARREAARLDFRVFCDSYFSRTFHLPWSADHLRVIERIQTCVMKGGQFALAMPRSSGKSSLCERACLWAVLVGHRSFVALIGASEEHAEEMLETIATELESNDQLFADFPEVCFPIRSLEGIANRCAGQLHQGQRTHIVWTDREIVFPTIEHSKASGAVIRVAGLTGRVRGLKRTDVDGRTLRPDLVIIDDAQTDASARSLSQCVTRERILSGAVLGLAGPDKKIAAIMPCKAEPRRLPAEFRASVRTIVSG